ncbi:hypothetical protein [Planctopirus hydrillae]|nr:hypothetical protein [Planctopirus hydrillae]
MFSRTAFYSIPTGPISGMIELQKAIATLSSPRSEVVAAFGFKDFLHATSID